MVHDGVGLGPVEIRIEAAAGGHQHLAAVVVADHPVALVSAGIAHHHDPNRIGGLMDHEVIDRCEGELLGEALVVADHEFHGLGRGHRILFGQGAGSLARVSPRCEL
jgi:hypothetical protein